MPQGMQKGMDMDMNMDSLSVPYSLVVVELLMFGQKEIAADTGEGTEHLFLPVLSCKITLSVLAPSMFTCARSCEWLKNSRCESWYFNPQVNLISCFSYFS